MFSEEYEGQHHADDDQRRDDFVARGTSERLGLFDQALDRGFDREPLGWMKEAQGEVGDNQTRQRGEERGGGKLEEADGVATAATDHPA